MKSRWLPLLLCASVADNAVHGGGSGGDEPITISLDLSVRHIVPATFASFTVDAGQLFEGVFWNNSHEINFSDPTLHTLTSALAPSLLRVGGTDADRIFYNMSDPSNVTSWAPPPGYVHTLPRGRAKALLQFTHSTGNKLVFGLNGVGPRVSGKWTSENAEEFVRFVCDEFPSTVHTWELGNEPNLWPVNFKFLVHSAQLVEDFTTLQQMLRNYANCTATKLAGPDVALQLVPGVMEHLTPSIEAFVKAGGGAVVDALTYHWYPLDGLETGKRVDPYYATPARATALKALTKGEELGKRMAALGSVVWTGETALAAFGGQALVSQTWAGVMYWADALGVAAAQGHEAVIRQTLWGQIWLT